MYFIKNEKLIREIRLYNFNYTNGYRQQVIVDNSLIICVGQLWLKSLPIM